jgi:hypothetical protein
MLTCSAALIMDQAATADTPQEVQIFDLLGLPPELRNRVYEEVCDVDPSCTYLLRLYHKKLFPEQPILLRTNRQIRHEALAIFYGRRRYIIEDLDPIIRHAPYLFNYLRHVKLHVSVYYDSCAEPSDCTLEVWYSEAGSLTVSPNLVYLGGHKLFCSCELKPVASEAEAKAKGESKNALLLFCDAVRLRRPTCVHNPGESRNEWMWVGSTLEKRVIECGMGDGASKDS